MVFLLNQTNIFGYLANLGYRSDGLIDNVEPVVAKNFNLLISITGDSKLLVKQERHNQEGKARGEFLAESQIHELARNFPTLSYWQSSISELLYFDRDNSILVFRYLHDYRDLANFYTKENIFDDRIARRIGTILASFHRDTYNRAIYRLALGKDRHQSETSAESLSLAITPLDLIQPSIAALTRSYLQAFPEILIDRSDFLQRAVQFAGLGLIQGIQAGLEYQKTLGNSGIAQLQVAKSLLCYPDRSMPTVFGTEFIQQVSIPA